MHFFKCDNMYYIRIGEEDSNQLIYYCCTRHKSLITFQIYVIKHNYNERNTILLLLTIIQN